MHSAAACLLVVAVHVLRYYDQVGLLLQIHQGLMSGVGFGPGNELAAPVVPFPDQLGVGVKSPGGGQLFGAVLAPEGIFSAAKCGNPAGGGNTCSGQYGDFGLRGDGLAVFFKVHGHSFVGRDRFFNY